MGMRHRTAVSMIRMQRQKAEASGSHTTGKTATRSARGVSFSQIDSASLQRPAVRPTPLQRHDQEESLRLLQRLRQALQPWSEDHSQASRDYESLQDELLRLSRHKHQQKAPVAEVWDNSAHPYPYRASNDADRLPYRTITIVNHEPQPLERLEVTPLDLSRYRQIVQETPAPTRTLTLVAVAEVMEPKATKPNVPDLLIEDEVQLGHATADLTQESLATRGSGSSRVAIHPKVALSLLDS